MGEAGGAREDGAAPLDSSDANPVPRAQEDGTQLLKVVTGGVWAIDLSMKFVTILRVRFVIVCTVGSGGWASRLQCGVRRRPYRSASLICRRLGA